MIAALYVETDGVYYDAPDVDPWDEARDARTYPGVWPVVAHPPCERWGRWWHGSPAKPYQFAEPGEDGGCFAAALSAVREWGGVIEHPAESHAWKAFGLARPDRWGGWRKADRKGITCYVEQGNYGHYARKGTWLYAVGIEPVELIWGPAPQRLHPVAVAWHGYEKARRIGMVSMVGGRDKKAIRNRTPLEFRDLLLALARTTWGLSA